MLAVLCKSYRRRETIKLNGTGYEMGSNVFQDRKKSYQSVKRNHFGVFYVLKVYAVLKAKRITIFLLSNIAPFDISFALNVEQNSIEKSMHFT